jgi:hypothetical protein
MAQSAKVLSIQALKDFRLSMIAFVEEARNALSGVDMELKRTRDWLERDQLSYWQMQVKRRHEAMMMARTELHRRKISQQGSDAISDTEQKEALREAQRRLHIAEEKVAIVKKLIPVFHQALADYIAHATPLADHLSGGIDRSLLSLEKMIQSLEHYLALEAPAAPRFEEPGGPAGPATTAARAGGSVTDSGLGQDQEDQAQSQGDAGKSDQDRPTTRPDGSPAKSDGSSSMSSIPPRAVNEEQDS